MKRGFTLIDPSTELRVTKGFTLIEILLVIGVIGILAGIVIMAINPARQLAQARNIGRRSDVKQILSAIQQYRIDNRGNLPTGLDSTLRMIGTSSSGCLVSCSGGSGPQTSISVRVNASNNDAEEVGPPNGYMYNSSSDLELTTDASRGNQYVGMRFTSVAIPQAVVIDSASIEFVADETNSVATSVTFYGQAHDNPVIFGSSNGDITARTRTSASVPWSSIPTWNTVGQTHQSPDLRTIVQEIVNRPGWASGNAMVFIVEGTGTRTAESYNGSAAQAPLLRVTYHTVTDELTANACLDLTDELVGPLLPSIPVDTQAGNAGRTRYATKTLSDSRVRVVACSPELGVYIGVDQ